MKNFPEICSTLRTAYFGEDAIPTDYKDSFIVNQAIELFSDCPDVLNSAYYTALDKIDTKLTKSLTLRQNCIEKLKTYSEILGISEAEVLRRILYFSVDESNKETTDTTINLSELKAEVVVLEKHLSAVMTTVETIKQKITKLEDGR